MKRSTSQMLVLFTNRRPVLLTGVVLIQLQDIGEALALYLIVSKDASQITLSSYEYLIK